MNQRNQFISELYPDLKKVARNVMGGKEGYEDLLNDTMIEMLNSKSPNFPTTKEKIFIYCVRAIKTNSIHQSVKERKRKSKHADLTVVINRKHDVDLSSRIDNETIDFAINFLPELEKKTFLLYVFDDFNYSELARETGIRQVYIYRIVERAKNLLRQYVKPT